MYKSEKFNSTHSSTKVIKLLVSVETLTATIHTPKASLNGSTDLGS